ncbi:ricin-type beta-trefoil lectin domain protein [Streptomyces seoulensis]|nr:ricin-type beta-trefoil lectin domain protein [Streptomyces seoulensis]
MKYPDPSPSPEPHGPFGSTDQELSAELRKWTGATPATHPVAELLDRHWEAAFAYARLCTDGPNTAGILTTQAFTRLFGQSLRRSGPTAAWRPRLLVTVRRIAGEWSTDHRRETLHPELSAAAGAGEPVAALLLPPVERRLLSRAFQRLPQTAAALLWHAEAEGEPAAAPARLLGLDEAGARVELGRARERLREECLQVHRELAPDQECLRYFRLLDVTCRRGGVDVDPDLRQHLAGCTHCRHTAGQLAPFDAGLGTALAEGVLGWRAREYRVLRLAAAAPAAEAAAGDDGPPSTAPAGGGPSATSTVPDAPTAPAASPPGPAPAPQVPPRPAESPSAPPSAPPWNPTGHLPHTATDAPAAPSTDDSRASGEPVVGPGREESRTGAPNGARPAEGRGVTAEPGVAAEDRAADTSATSAGVRDAGAVSGVAGGGRRSARRSARRAARNRNLAVAVATVSGLVVLPLAVWAAVGPGDGAAPAAGGRPSGGAATPSGASAPAPAPTQAGAGDAGRTTLRGRLHNAASGLCVGIVGEKAVPGAETELATCSARPGQQWAYETDGLLRSGAAPGLCLDSHLAYSVRLAPCVAAAAPGGRDIRYDFTLQGTLVPRFDQDLALTPAATDGAGALVLKTRSRTDTQRWTIDAVSADLRMRAANWAAHGSPPP